jgi:radical SAM protein with 4Fe4S-binding SPASM domain
MSPREETGRAVDKVSLDVYVEMLKLKNQRMGLSVSAECDETNLPQTGGDGQESPKGVTCAAGRSSFSISWDGILRPCNTFPNVSADLNQLSFRDAWKQINSAVKDFPLPVECVGCSYYKICKHCVAEHASGAEIGHANPATCEWIRRMTTENLVKLQ